MKFDSIRQAITTRYFAPGNVRGSRIKATAQAGSVTLDYDDALNLDDNHRAAAKALVDKFGWLQNPGVVGMASGVNAAGDYVHVILAE